MSKVTVVGAGNVGATCANVLAVNEVANEVCLIDIKEGFAEGKAMDIMQTAQLMGFDTVVEGVTNDYSKTSGSDVVIITSGLPRKPGMTREELIGVNAGIVKSVCDQVLKYSPNAILVVVSNPMDTMAYLTLHALKLPRNRVIGMGGALDSARLKYFLSQALKCNANDVDGFVIGGHGDIVGDGEPYFVKSLAREVYDVSGAGDTTIAYLATCMANGMPIRDAVDIANYAAGIQVGKVGTSSVYWQEVRDLISNEDHGMFHKILTNEDVERFRKDNQNKKIVFTNGCFDILHIGHKRYLQQAAALGDILVIGVNSDDSVRRLKGPSRPVNGEQDRAEMLSALGFVDYVVIFDEDTPYELIKKIQPDVLVKGGDYKPEEVVGRDIVEARGGRLELIQFVEGKSTTNIINKISHHE